MKKVIEILSGIALLLGSLSGLILVLKKEMLGCLTIGGGIFNYIVIYAIITSLAVLGAITVYYALKRR